MFLIFTSLVSCKRAGPDSLSHGWKRINAEPLPGAIVLQQAEDSGCIWRVNQRPGDVSISRVSTRIYDHHVELRMETPSGILIGEDRGEWGGSLSLLDAKGAPPKKILDKNVLRILQEKSAFLVITGSLPANEGSVWLYSNVGSRGWLIEKKTDLHGYPNVIQKSNDGILLVDGDGVYLLNDAFKVRQLADLPLMQTHPNSIAEDSSGAIYVGMEAFVVRLVPDHSGYTHEWFAGEGCLP